MITATALSRDFIRYKHKSGLKGALSNLFSREKEVIHAVKDVSFQIEDGEFVGYIGPNGAGKSTTIKMLCGILVPTSGQVSVNGIDPSKSRVENAKHIGAVFGQRSQLWWDLPIADSYALFQKMYRVDDAEFNKRLAVIREMLELDEFWDAPVRQLSLGQRMRGEFGAALLHEPQVLYLDEPTLGMDVLVKEQIKGFLKRINQERKVSILLTTHDLKDVEDLCSRVMLINKGALLFDGGLNDMRAQSTAKTCLNLTFESECDPDLINELTPALQQAGIDIEPITPWRIAAQFHRKQYTPIQVIERASKLGTLSDMSLVEPPIDAVVAESYRWGGC